MSEVLIEISRTLGRIEGKLNAVADEQINHARDDASVQATLATRITALEKSKWTASGFAAGAGAVVSLIVSAIGYVFVGHK